MALQELEQVFLIKPAMLFIPTGLLPFPITHDYDMNDNTRNIHSTEYALTASATHALAAQPVRVSK